MVGTPSGLTVFNLDLPEIIEEAFERAGIESRTGYELLSARRSLSLLMLEWANRGINLWTIEERSMALTYGVGQYTLESDIVDVIEQMVQIPPGSAGSSGPTRYNLTRVSVSTQATRTNPGITGRPTEVWYDRQEPAPIANIWPLPGQQGPYVLYYWVLRRIDDPGAYTNTMDVPFRFLPALIAGLAYYLAVKFLTADRADTRWAVMFLEQRIIRLHDDYEATFLAAAQEDRERATLTIVPRGSSYRIGR
jgi:hypothetical protein